MGVYSSHPDQTQNLRMIRSPRPAGCHPHMRGGSVNGDTVSPFTVTPPTCAGLPFRNWATVARLSHAPHMRGATPARAPGGLLIRPGR